MTNMDMPAAIALYFGDLSSELDKTRTVLSRLDEKHFDFKPHSKSGSLRQLGTHLAQLVAFHTAVLTIDDFDFMTNPFPKEEVNTNADLLAVFDRNVVALTSAMQKATPEHLAKEWIFRAGDHVIFKAPRAIALRSFCISHSVHHRAQLTIYMRLLDIPMPGLYGPSADES